MKQWLSSAYRKRHTLLQRETCLAFRMNRRTNYRPLPHRDPYFTSRRIRLTITLSLFTAGAITLSLLAVALFAPIGTAFRPAAAGATAEGEARQGAEASHADQDGSVAEGEVTVFDTDHPAVARLDPALLSALQTAASDAAAEEGITFYVNGGWRSPQLQERMLENAVHEYGSRAEALRWVATPERSAHVSGDAVDIGPFDASYWLGYNGADYGICQVYANESWHFELRPDAVQFGCPELYTDPTEDPRIQ